MRIQRVLTGGMMIAALLAVALVGSIPTQTKAGVYACPDMAGPGGLPDGHVDASDLAAFAAAKGVSSSTADFNEDGAVDAVDQAIFESVFGQSNFSCETFWGQAHSGSPMCIDMNVDGYIDGSDLSAFAAAKGSNDMNGDFSGDSQINDIDQTMLTTHLGESNYLCPGAAYAVVGIDLQPPVEQLPPENQPTKPAPVADNHAITSDDGASATSPSAVAGPQIPLSVEANVATPVVVATASKPILLTGPEPSVSEKGFSQARGRSERHPLNVHVSNTKPHSQITLPVLPGIISLTPPTLPEYTTTGTPQAVAPSPKPKKTSTLPALGLGIPGLMIGALSLRRKHAK